MKSKGHLPWIMVILMGSSGILLDVAGQNQFQQDLTQQMIFDQNQPQSVSPPTAEEQRISALISRGVMQLTLSLDRAINSNSGMDNTVYAPVSIASALALVLLAANGRTFDELATVLGLAAGGIDLQNNSHLVHQHLGRLLQQLDYTQPFHPVEEIRIGSALFVQNDYPVRPAYRQTAESLYMCEIRNVDYKNDGTGAQKALNDWVTDKTMGKITKLVEDVPPTATRVIIASALYFKGSWERPFFETKSRPFFGNGRKSPKTGNVMLMSNGGAFPYHKDTILDCEILGLPYKGNGSTMYIVVPTNSNKERLRELEAKLTPVHLERLVGSTRYEQTVLLFPKMKLESSIDLSAALQSIGARTLFDPSAADLSILSNGNMAGQAQFAPSFSSGIRTNTQTAAKPQFAQFPPLNREESGEEDRLIFSRFGGGTDDDDDTPATSNNCSEIFNVNSMVEKCQQQLLDENNTNRNVTYKKFGEKIGRKITRRRRSAPRRRVYKRQNSFDQLRQSLVGNNENPGIYADKVLHKVYMDITETGTEAAGTTTISLSRGGDIVTFRVDVPFLFFIRNEATKLVLFWGTVAAPELTIN